MEFTLRPLKTTDAVSFSEHANNPKIAGNLTNNFPHPYTIQHAEQFIERANKSTPSNILTIIVNGKASGALGLHPQDDISFKNAELGYWLAEPFWGKGIVTKAVKEMVDYSFANFEINRIFARPFGSNIASQKVLEKAGFVLEARFEKTLFKNGVYLDELVYAVRRQANK